MLFPGSFVRRIDTFLTANNLLANRSKTFLARSFHRTFVMATRQKLLSANYSAQIRAPKPPGSENPRWTVDDYTNFNLLWSNLFRYSAIVAETAVWAGINIFTLGLFMWLSIFSFFLYLFGFRKIVGFINGLYPCKIGNQMFVLSSVNVWTPGLHGSYVPEESKLNFDKAENFDFDLSIFFARLCALAYETPEILEATLTEWGLQIESAPHESCTVYFIYHPEKNWLVMAFKGTSPFNLNEWLTDAIMYKVRPSDDRLPGMVHEGFYRAIWNDTDKTYDDIVEKLTRLNAKLKSPNLWITGHSLGAAVATMFFGHLVWDSTRLNINVNVKGAYTFGTPRSGDSEYAHHLSTKLEDSGKFYYRVINANDIVCTVPLGATKRNLQGAEETAESLRSSDHNKSSFAPFAGIKGALNYEHFGRSWSLNYNGRMEKGEPGFLSRIQNFGDRSIETALGPYYFLRGIATGKNDFSLLRVVGNFTTPFFLTDHYPCEYIEHLEKAKQFGIK